MCDVSVTIYRLRFAAFAVRLPEVRCAGNGPCK